MTLTEVQQVGFQTLVFNKALRSESLHVLPKGLLVPMNRVIASTDFHSSWNEFSADDGSSRWYDTVKRHVEDASFAMCLFLFMLFFQRNLMSKR